MNKYVKQYNRDYNKNHSVVSEQYNQVLENLNNITAAIEKGILTDSLIQRAEVLENEKAHLEARLKEMRLLIPIEYKDVEYLYKQWKELKRNTEEYRIFIQQFVKEIRVCPYDFDILIDVGLGVTNELTEIITMRRGELYALFDSRVKE